MPILANAQGFQVHGGTYIDVSGDYHSQLGSQRGMETLHGMIVPGAFHNSKERFDPPKCHPRTRVAVLQKISAWADDTSLSPSIMWLYGPAGAGKSAIAQSMAERYHETGSLLASFFFSRTAAGRNNDGRLIPTIAYQLAQNVKSTRAHIEAVVESDPAIFSMSLETQLQSLVIDPLCLATPRAPVAAAGQPKLIIIDGLDECNDPSNQENIISVLSSSFSRHSQLPVRLLLLSRPEMAIRSAFCNSDYNHLSLVLDDSFSPDSDIRQYLMDVFLDIRRRHVLKAHIPDSWPSDDDLKILVRKSSGQFIYASTVARYVQSPRHRPMERLNVVFGIGCTEDDAPFAELDALYIHILGSAAKGQISTVLRVFAMLMLEENWHLFLNDSNRLEGFLNLKPGDLELALIDLHSIIHIPNDGLWNSSNMITFLHASLPDFLSDPARSLTFFVDRRDIHATFTRACIKGLSSEVWSVRHHSAANLSAHVQAARIDVPILMEIIQINLSWWMASIVEAVGSVRGYREMSRYLEWADENRSNAPLLPDIRYKNHLETLDAFLMDMFASFPRQERFAEFFILARHLRYEPECWHKCTFQVGFLLGFRTALDDSKDEWNRGRERGSSGPLSKDFVNLIMQSESKRRLDGLCLDLLSNKERAGIYHIDDMVYARISQACTSFVFEGVRPKTYLIAGVRYWFPENIPGQVKDSDYRHKLAAARDIGLDILPKLLSMAPPLKPFIDYLSSHGVARLDTQPYMELTNALSEYIKRCSGSGKYRSWKFKAKVRVIQRYPEDNWELLLLADASYVGRRQRLLLLAFRLFNFGDPPGSKRCAPSLWGLLDQRYPDDYN